jgi:membrane-associated protein
MEQLSHVILDLGLPGIAIVVFLQCGFPFAFFLPGDTLLFTAGLFASRGHFPLVLAIAVIFIANFAGVTFGYWSGRGLGKRFLKKEDSRPLYHNYVERAEKFYERHGGKAIILSPFIPGVRSFVPIVAGVANMDYRKLMIYNAIGAGLWTISIPVIGFYAGSWLEQHGVNIDTLILPIILLVIIVSLAGPVVHALSDKKTREQLLRKFRKN